MVERRRLAVGLGVQLPVEQEAEVAVSLPQGGIIPVLRERLHQAAHGALAQRIGDQDATEIAECFTRISAVNGSGGESFQSSEIGLLARIPLRQHPLLRAAFQ